MKKQITIAATALLAAGLLASAQAQTIKIGELNSYKTFPAFLEPYKKGWELALEEINKAQFQELTRVDTQMWQEELDLHGELFDKLKERLPKQLVLKRELFRMSFGALE